mgnify:CR=1 FL=1|tara:strand:+ start:806 stop:1072 length:267 start_codon:yes stop_codon:yes gene_type:complete
MNYSINLNTISSKTYKKISDLDMKLINTEDYLGVCYFWDHKYRNTGLREASIAKRKRIHLALMNDGLDVTKSSDEHLKIIKKLLNQEK